MGDCLITRVCAHVKLIFVHLSLLTRRNFPPVAETRVRRNCAVDMVVTNVQNTIAASLGQDITVLVKTPMDESAVVEILELISQLLTDMQFD